AAGAIVNGSYQESYGTSALATNTWTFLAATYDGATMRLYVNGNLVSSNAGTGSILTSNNPLQIGGDNLYRHYFHGLIDNVRIYDTALSQSQIQADMNTPVGGSTQGTAPTVTGVTPANGATNTSTTGNVQVTFSGAVDPTTVNTSTVQLLDPSNAAVAA